MFRTLMIMCKIGICATRFALRQVEVGIFQPLMNANRRESSYMKLASIRGSSSCCRFEQEQTEETELRAISVSSVTSCSKIRLQSVSIRVSLWLESLHVIRENSFDS